MTRKGPTKVIKPENMNHTNGVVKDAEGMTFMRVKKSEKLVKNATKQGESKLEIDYNSSSKQLINRNGNQSEVKKVKNISKNRLKGTTTKTVSNNEKRKLSKVSLLGLFEMTTHSGTRWEGKSELAAAELAVKHINERGLLPGYSLELITNDTQVTRKKKNRKVFAVIFSCHKCDPGVGVDRFFHAIYTQNKTKMVMLLGSACPEVTESLAKVVPYWNIIQVSFGSTAPALSDREEFPYFFRTVMPDSAHNPAKIAFIRRFKWDTVTTFSQNEEVHSLAVNDLVTQLERANISCAATLTFGKTNFRDQLKILRDLDIRIIIGSFSDEIAPKIFCEAYKLGMYGADYAWILQETFEHKRWWREVENLECSQKSLHKAVESVLIVSSYNNIVGEEKSISGLTNSRFEKELSAMNVTKPFSRFAPETYDAVWSIALALKGAEASWRNETRINRKRKRKKLEGFDYTRKDLAMDFLEQFHRLKFQGISGNVSFDGADRVGTTAFYQIQFAQLQPVALYYPETEFLDFTCPNCMTIKWQNNVVPIAKRVFKLRSIKLSSYKLSNITAVGCVFVYAAVILLGLDHSTLPSTDTAFPAVCTARVYLLSAGFSLTFGSMFAKTYRVHRIFTHSWAGICKDKMLKDTKLISMVCCLLLVDALVVTFWTLSDPMERHLRNLTLEISLTDRSVVYQPQYIGFSVYGAVITSVSVVVLANLLSEQVTLAFIIITSIILASTTATLCLVFLPKMNDIWKKGKHEDPVIQSMGLKLECNTRRFVTDERKELQYRVEVQNRVYRKEMASLDAEIAKLERMLENRSSSTSSSQISVLPHIKPEIVIEGDFSENTKSSRPSISGTLPLLLLSVLPPVIPRASWPNTEHMTIPMRRSICFSSQPQILDERGVRTPAIDLLNLRLTQQQNQERSGFLNKIKGLFGSRAPSRKTSTASLAPSHIANALKSHMSILTGLLPNTSSSCHVLNTNPIDPDPLRKVSFAQSGNAINSTIEIVEPELIKSRIRRKSMAFTISAHVEKIPDVEIDEVEEQSSEPRVNFILPNRRRSSIIHQNSQPTLRERVRGSPRFPHRIVPTSSLNALEDTFEDKICGNNEQISPAKWKSMEEETFHTINHKLSSTSNNSSNLERITIAGDNNVNIESIDEEITQAPNHVNDDFYGVV
ncbi:CLUMA_CG007569, isoform A [Clunio marinus]|uniref:Gamma-aminobutyric acid type B receptor subunit 2 n=1 Tax=Clunio marinus TaxID=568069 RepID=A0A1J1I188_9DIPT|nr:CLUMA_CG007569, isoform A [Clunio marinus]